MNAHNIRTATVSLTRELLLAPRLASRSITRFILDGLALPPHLEPLGSLILAFTTGTAASTALHHFLHRNREHRDRINLAVHLVVRMVTSSPQYRHLLDRPENLLHDLDDRVMPVLNAILVEGEANVAMARVKRKVWDDAESPEASSKRRRKSAPDRIMTERSDIVDETVALMAASPCKPIPDVVDAEATRAVDEADMQAQLLAEAHEDDDSVMESVEDYLEEQHPSSGRHSTDHEANNSRGTPMPQQASFSSQGPLPGTSSSQSQTPLVPSSVAQPTSASKLVMPPPTLARFVESPYKSHHTALKLGASSPTPAPHRIEIGFSGYGLDYNDSNLYPTPSANSTRQVSASDVEGSPPGVRHLEQELALSVRDSKPSHHGRPKSNAALQRKTTKLLPSAKAQQATTTTTRTRGTKKVYSRFQRALKVGRTYESYTPHTTTHSVVNDRQHLQHYPFQVGNLDEAQSSNDELSQEISEDLSTATSAQASIEAPKKKRGRPRKDTTQGSILTTSVHDPAESDSEFFPEISDDSSATTSAQASVEALKRKRGRPRKDATQAFTFTTPVHDPAASVPDAVTVITTAKRRGRPPKTPTWLTSD